MMMNTPTHSKKKSEDDDGMMPDISIFQKTFVTVKRNDKHARVELYISGAFGAIEDITNEIHELNMLSTVYPSIVIYINSPGGRVDTLVNILNIVRRFDYVTTIGCGDSASAGFMLWAAGDLRVCMNNTIYMHHRESYGAFGKTAQHVDRATHIESHCGQLAKQLTEDILSEDEQERSRLTELYFTAEQLIGRGVAISYDEFCERDQTQIDTSFLITVNGRNYIRDANNNCIPVMVQPLSDHAYNIHAMVYGTDEFDFGPSDQLIENAISKKVAEAEAQPVQKEYDDEIRVGDKVQVMSETSAHSGSSGIVINRTTMYLTVEKSNLKSFKVLASSVKKVTE